MRTLLIWIAGCLTLSAGGHRIASYSPGATQTLLDLGCADEIVLATRWCPLPKAHPAARTADVFVPDLERLLLARPDLVILPRMANPLWAEKCARAGLRTVVLHRESPDAVSQDLRLIAVATSRNEQAKPLADALMKRPALRPRTILVVWDGVMAGPESYLAEPLAAAGLKSSLPQGAWLKFDWELLASTRPEAVLWIQNESGDRPIAPDPEKNAEMSRLPGVRSLVCVTRGQIYLAGNDGKWLPGSGLTKVIPQLIDLRKQLDR